MSCIYNANSGELLTMAVALSAVLAQGRNQTELAKLGAFFTIVGDTLALYALEPSQSNTSQSQQEAATDAAITSAISLGETL